MRLISAPADRIEVFFLCVRTSECMCVCVRVRVHVCYIFSVSSFTFLICKQALIVSRETCCGAHSIQARTFWCCETSAALFCRSVAAPPRVFLEWHHTVTAVLASTHLPVITHTSGLSCSWTPRHRHIMNRVRPDLPACSKKWRTPCMGL